MGMDRVTLNKAARATRSGFRRYPKQLLESWRSRGHIGHGLRPHPPAEHEEAAAAPDFSGFLEQEVAGLWIGHATVLLRVAGRTVLTDPVFSDRIGMSLAGVTFGLSRLAAPAVSIHQLPRIDLILLSHAHFDHLDRPSLRRLAEVCPEADVITACNTRRLIPKAFHNVIELKWDETVDIEGMKISAMRPAHWGARTAIDRHRKFNSYVIEHQRRRVLFAGDTAHTDAFDRVKDVDLAVFGIGAYDPWDGCHANPEQVWSMFTRLQADHLLPMHHSTFPLGEEALDDPIRRMRLAAGDQLDRVVCQEMGCVWGHDGASRYDQLVVPSRRLVVPLSADPTHLPDRAGCELPEGALASPRE